MKNKIFIILLTLFSCNENNDGNTSRDNDIKKESNQALEGHLSYLVFGSADTKFRQRQIIAGKYRFFYQGVGNCEITDSLRNYIKKHNELTDNKLNSKLGENWKNRFEYSVDSLYSLDSVAIGIAESDSYIKNFKLITAKKNTNPDFYPNLESKVFPTRKENIFLVTIEGYGAIGGRIVTLNYLRITVDIRNKSILNIDSTAYNSM